MSNRVEQRQRQPGQYPQGEQNEHRRRDQPPSTPLANVWGLRSLVKKLNGDERNRNHQHEAQHRVGNKGPAKEKVSEASEQISHDDSAAEGEGGEQVR